MEGLRDDFDESEGKKLSGCEEHEEERKGVKRRKMQCDEINRDSDTIYDCRKISAFKFFHLRFGFLSPLSLMPYYYIREFVKKAVEAYHDDVDRWTSRAPLRPHQGHLFQPKALADANMDGRGGRDRHINYSLEGQNSGTLVISHDLVH
ncbi:hypothetical protein PR048_005755 [Dryococelus australis]|uniref:Uncharacterized protein n=1 Tax=Dryococelus australis TaxID=614101 RepID=A0ABQ9I929_9NEOP|nr:hypothetical protein PR048_005755 [Dryococelus australis]